jgi:hypothetical protein
VIIPPDPTATGPIDSLLPPTERSPATRVIPAVQPAVAAAPGVPFSVNTDLTSPSHLSAWAIDRYLQAYTPLPPLGSTFKAAETEFGVNALYLVAHAMEETGFGTSYIAQAFHNLFGWNAVDFDPVGMATRFDSYAQSVTFVAQQVSTQYLTPSGRFYGGAPTLLGMYMYATDPAWADNITRIADEMPIQTLAGLRVSMATPTLDAPIAVGGTVTVTLAPTPDAGRLPAGLHAAYRFIPEAVQVDDATVPPADPPFVLGDGVSSDGQLILGIVAPTTPGAYRIEFELRDSDGTPMTEPNLPAVPPLETAVHAMDSVSFSLAEDADGLVLTVTNTGIEAIPAVDPAPTNEPVAGSAIDPDFAYVQIEPEPAVPTPPTRLEVWLKTAPNDPGHLVEFVLPGDLLTDDTWDVRLNDGPSAAGQSATVVAGVLVAGEPHRFDGSVTTFTVSAPVATAATAAGGVLDGPLGIRLPPPPPLVIAVVPAEPLPSPPCSDISGSGAQGCAAPISSYRAE